MQPVLLQIPWKLREEAVVGPQKLLWGMCSGPLDDIDLWLCDPWLQLHPKPIPAARLSSRKHVTAGYLTGPCGS